MLFFFFISWYFPAVRGAHKDAGAIVETITSKGVNCACFVPTLLVEFVNYLERNPDEAKEVPEGRRSVQDRSGVND